MPRSYPDSGPPASAAGGPGRAALAIMARHPDPGCVKTRLAATLGSARTDSLYRAWLADLAERFTAGPLRLVWFFSPDERDFGAVVGRGCPCVAQGEGDLGDRMARAFERLLVEPPRGAPSPCTLSHEIVGEGDPGLEGGFTRVVMIGADVPHVPDEWLDAAVQGLNEYDVVLGPADDGGYYLVAMRTAHDLFRGIPMGTEHVLAATEARIAALGLRHWRLPPLFDIDREADLPRLARFLIDHPDVRLPRTQAWLTQAKEEACTTY